MGQPVAAYSEAFDDPAWQQPATSSEHGEADAASWLEAGRESRQPES